MVAFIYACENGYDRDEITEGIPDLKSFEDLKAQMETFVELAGKPGFQVSGEAMLAELLNNRGKAATIWEMVPSAQKGKLARICESFLQNAINDSLPTTLYRLIAGFLVNEGPEELAKLLEDAAAEVKALEGRINLRQPVAGSYF